MKKLLLGILLLAVLIGVSYLKTERESERTAQAFLEGHEVAARKAELKIPDVDSLIVLIDQKQTDIITLRTAMADTLAQRDQIYAHTVDSLKSAITERQTEIARLEKQLAASQASAKTTTSAKKTTSKQASQGQILSHYKAAVSRLPVDLSAYEYRVALAEVRTETAAKFKITVVRLDQIREANNLDY